MDTERSNNNGIVRFLVGAAAVITVGTILAALYDEHETRIKNLEEVGPDPMFLELYDESNEK